MVFWGICSVAHWDVNSANMKINEISSSFVREKIEEETNNLKEVFIPIQKSIVLLAVLYKQPVF